MIFQHNILCIYYTDYYTIKMIRAFLIRVHFISDPRFYSFLLQCVLISLILVLLSNFHTPVVVMTVTSFILFLFLHHLAKYTYIISVSRLKTSNCRYKLFL